MDEGSRRQLGGTAWSVLGSNHIKQEPGIRARLDTGRVGGGGECKGPDGASFSGVLPCAANHAIGYHPALVSSSKRVRAEEVGDDLFYRHP